CDKPERCATTALHRWRRHQVLLPRKENKTSASSPIPTSTSTRISLESKQGRDFTWVQSIGILFGSQQFYVGARKSRPGTDPTTHARAIQWSRHQHPVGRRRDVDVAEGDLQIKRVGELNSIVAEVVGVVKIGVRVVPITEEESRIHDLRAGYRSPVKIGVPMPVMGGAEKYSTSHLFATDCAVSKFGLKREGAEIEDPPTVACGAQDGIQGIVCKR
ncbi:hypothetical protein ACMD2_26632, partial [Ananas comosus]